MWCFEQGFTGWTWFGGVGMMILWVVIILVIGFWGFNWFNNNRMRSTSNALDIARERYAKGEISKDEFDQLKKTL